MVRRPLLEPNLSVGGLTFLGISLFVFLMANVVTGTPGATDVAGSQRADQLQNLESSQTELNTLKTHGPGFPLIYLLPHISTQSLLGRTMAEDIEPVPDTPVFSVRRGQRRDGPGDGDPFATGDRARHRADRPAALRQHPRPASRPRRSTCCLPYTAMWTGA